MAKRPLPSPELLRQLLTYRPSTGRLIWNERTGPYSKRWNARYAGTTAGTLDGDGYIAIKVFDRSMAAHRVIWAMVYGCWPECVDHKNGVKTDNRLRNLRAVSRAINQRNQKRHSSNTSGRTGVYWASSYQKWFAAINLHGKTMYLGAFSNKEDAIARRVAEEKRLGFTGRQ